MKFDWEHFETPETKAVNTWMHQLKLQSVQAGVLALLPEHNQSAVAVLQACAAETGLPLIGAVFPELIVEAHFKHQGVLLLGLNPMPNYCLCAGLSLPNQRSAAIEALTNLVENSPDSDSTLLLMFDGLYGHTASFLADLYYELGDLCRYAGINAGSETFQPMPCLFDGQRCLDDAVLGINLPKHPGVALEHAYKISDLALTASATSGNRIARIDLQPAFEKYVELLREHYAQEVTHENFYSMGVHFPFALIRANGEFLIRIPVAVDDEGALFCVGEVPEGALLTVAQGIAPGSTDAVGKLATHYQAMQAISGLFFYCAGRRTHMGENAATLELSQLAAALPSETIIGALTLGEIGNSAAGGYPLFHNATLVALPVELSK